MAENITVNLSEIARERLDLLSVFGGLDAKRPEAWLTYGYKTDLKFDDLRQAYERGGAGHGAVHKLLEYCWMERPRIKTPESDEESDWEKKLNKLFSRRKIWKKLRDFDRRNLVGHYAALVYRVRDGKALSEPLVKASELVDVVPLYEDQIEVQRWQEDLQAEDYGQPLMYKMRVRSPSSKGDTKAKPDGWIDLHPSRVQILAEGAVNDFFEGVPLLRAGFNHLVDLEKLSGGGAEAAYKNSSRSVVIEFDKDSSPEVIVQNADGTESTKSLRDVVSQQVQGLNKNQDAAIALQGAKATTLQTTVANLGPQFEISANLFSASVGIPFTILFGQQTGRLASDEDKTAMQTRCKSRQDNELTPMLEEFVTRMQAAGIVDAGEFEIEWPDMGAPTDAEKVDRLGKMATAMKTAFDAGLTEPLFDANELRQVVDYEPRADDGMPTEGDPARDPAAADPAKPANDPAAKVAA